MPWKFGGNFRQVEATCAYNWMECPTALINYIWTEVVTDVADCLANEIILWRVLAALLIVAALCKLIFWQKKWTKEVKKYKRNLNLVCSKLQDLDLKMSVLNYKVQYGTLPLSYISKNSGIDFRDIHLTSSHLNENNSWVKYFLESLSDNGLKKEDHLAIKSLFDVQPKLSISDFNDQNINQTNIFSNLEDNNDLEQETYIAYKNSKTRIQKNQIENSANSSSPKFQLERKLSAMDWSVVSSRHSLTDLSKQKNVDAAFNACLNTIRKNRHVKIVEPKKDMKMPQTEIQTSESGCFESTTITNNNNNSSDEFLELYVVPQNTITPSDSIIFHIQDETILSNSLPNNIDLEGDLYQLKEELGEIQSSHRNCYSIDSWLSTVFTSTNLENISENDSNKVDIKLNEFRNGVNFSELNNQSSNNYKVDHDLENSTDNASNLVNTCATYNKVVMKEETPVQFDENAKNEECVTFREAIESDRNQESSDIVQKEILTVCIEEDENQNTKEGNNNALEEKNITENNCWVEVNNYPENIISMNNILLSTSRENISILQKSSINDFLKDMDDDGLTTLLLQEVIRYRKELSIQIESRESYNYIDNQSGSLHYQPKTLDMITEESSASSCTDKPSKTYILEENECADEKETYSKEPNFERCEFVDEKEMYSKEPTFQDKNENIYFNKYYTVEVSTSKIQISSSSNNQEINNPAESKESVKSICLTTNIEDLHLREEASTGAISEILETCFSSKTENNIDMFTEILENDSTDQYGGDSETSKCNKNTKNIVITEILENDSTDQHISDSETTECNKNTKNIVITDDFSDNNTFSNSAVNEMTASSDVKSDVNIKHILASSSYLSDDKTISPLLETEQQCRSLNVSDLKSNQADIGDILSQLNDSQNLKSEIEFQDKECNEKISSSCETVKHSENELFENKEVECSFNADISLEKLTVEEEAKDTNFSDEKLDNDNISLQNDFHINDEAESLFKSTNTVTTDNLFIGFSLNVLHNKSLNTLIEIKPEIQNKNEESIKINNEIISENETLNNCIENDCDVQSKLIELEMKNQETLEDAVFDLQNQSEQQKKFTAPADTAQEVSVDKCSDMDSENHREKITKINPEDFCNINKEIVPELQSQCYNCDVVQTCNNTKNIEKNISLFAQSGNSNNFLRILKPKNNAYHVFCKASKEYQYHQERKQPEKRIQNRTCVNLNKITSKSTSELNSNNRCNLALTGKSNVGSVNRRSKSYASPRNIPVVQNDKTEIQRLSKSLERSSKSSLKSQKREIPNTDQKTACESKRKNICHFTESPRMFILRNSKELTNDKKHEAKSNRFSNSLPSTPKNTKNVKEMRSNINQTRLRGTAVPLDYESRSNSSFTSLPSSPRLCYSKNLKEVISDKKIKSRSSISFNQFSPRDTSFCNRNITISKLDLKIPNESQIPANKSVSKSCIPVLKNRSEIIKPIEHALNVKSFVRGPLTISTNRYKENKKEVVNKSVLEKDEQFDKSEQNETIGSNLCSENNLPSKGTISENIFSRSEELESNVVKETQKNKNLSFKSESKKFSGICMHLETKNIIESPKSKFSLLPPKSQRENKFSDNSSSISCKETRMLLKPVTLNSSTSTLNLID